MGRVEFSSLDAVMAAMFGLGALGIGLWGRYKAKGSLQYFAAGRALTLPAFVATLVSTWYGGVLGVGESVSSYGIGTWLLFGFPYYVFALIYAFFYAGKVRSAKQLSLPERLESRYGRGVGLIGAGIVYLLALPSANVFMLGILTQTMTGWPLPICVILGAVIACVFLFKGGLLADVRLGIVAFVAMYLGFFVLDLHSMLAMPLSQALHALPDKNMLKIDGGQGALAVFTYFILGAWTLVDPGFHQRVSSSIGPEVARKGVLTATVAFMVCDFLTIVAGIYAVVGLKQQPSSSVAIFPAFGAQALPSGLRGIFFLGLIGGTLSATVGYTLVSGSTFGREILGRINPGMSDVAATNWSRFGLFASAAIAVCVALVVRSVIDIWYSWAGALVGALLLPVMLAYAKKGPRSPSSTAVGSAGVVGTLVGLGWMFYGIRTDDPLLSVSWLGKTFSLGSMLPALVASVATLGLFWMWDKIKHLSRE